MNDRTKGLLIILFGVLVISPDAVVVRFLSEGGAMPWTIIFWKLIFSIPISASFAIWEAGGWKQLWKSCVEGRKYYVLAILFQCCVDALFTFSYVFTTAANALLLVSLNPLWCALAGKFIIGDILPTRTYIALLLALGCILLIFVPEVIERRSMNDSNNDNDNDNDVSSIDVIEQQLGDPSLKGNIMALFTGLGLASYITVVRYGGTKSTKNINLIGAALLSSILLAIISLIIQGRDVLPGSFWNTMKTDTDTESSSDQQPQLLWQFWVTSIAEGIMLGVIFVTMTIAPKYITGAEVGLCILLETVLGPLFVYLAYGDVPSVWTLVGGSLLLVVLAVHESRPLFEKARVVQRSISRRLSKRMSSSQVITIPVPMEDEDSSSDMNMNKEISNEVQVDTMHEEEGNVRVIGNNNSDSTNNDNGDNDKK
eukprot:CAMPEP_0170845184 /NCGR_PEP_ID=MMETSP0734-20130129/7431_1 /TAXON_ID=186038 /ORGANISM="Fragilariopsis kerguelensis, Strain L26-C5" /LENGTH=425 /DNA_ID=CAMNT_0011213953 /DNA_START=190 /DNA_END=1467 /DNA_ORIENTATION=-